MKLYLKDLTAKSLLPDISKLKFAPVTDRIWETLQDEGWPIEIDDGDRNNYTFTTLTILDKDSYGLMAFDDEVVEKYNALDIELKDKWPGYLDLIDYDNGKVYIVRHNT